MRALLECTAVYTYKIASKHAHVLAADVVRKRVGVCIVCPWHIDSYNQSYRRHPWFSFKCSQAHAVHAWCCKPWRHILSQNTRRHWLALTVCIKTTNILTVQHLHRHISEEHIALAYLGAACRGHLRPPRANNRFWHQILPSALADPPAPLPFPYLYGDQKTIAAAESIRRFWKNSWKSMRVLKSKVSTPVISFPSFSPKEPWRKKEKWKMSKYQDCCRAVKARCGWDVLSASPLSFHKPSASSAITPKFHRPFSEHWGFPFFANPAKCLTPRKIRRKRRAERKDTCWTKWRWRHHNHSCCSSL